MDHLYSTGKLALLPKELRSTTQSGETQICLGLEGKWFTESVIAFGGLRRPLLHHHRLHRPRDLDLETRDGALRTFLWGGKLIYYNTRLSRAGGQAGGGWPHASSTLELQLRTSVQDRSRTGIVLITSAIWMPLWKAYRCLSSPSASRDQ